MRGRESGRHWPPPASRAGRGAAPSPPPRGPFVPVCGQQRCPVGPQQEGAVLAGNAAGRHGPREAGLLKAGSLQAVESSPPKWVSPRASVAAVAAGHAADSGVTWVYLRRRWYHRAPGRQPRGRPQAVRPCSPGSQRAPGTHATVFTARGWRGPHEALSGYRCRPGRAGVGQSPRGESGRPAAGSHGGPLAGSEFAVGM